MPTILGDEAATVELDETLYPKDAIYGAAYVFIDRCYVHLDRAGDGRIKVTLRGKKPGLDDLLAIDIGEASAFDDPLGIAMSWEEKYKKKTAAADATTAAEVAKVEGLIEASPIPKPEKVQ